MTDLRLAAFMASWFTAARDRRAVFALDWLAWQLEQAARGYITDGIQRKT